MSQPLRPAVQRHDIIDALRGSALFGILLLHSVEHWDFLHLPEGRPGWLVKLDAGAIENAFFLFGGKAYAIFALMFGISFFITLERWKGGSRNASGRFLWRLAILGVLGYVHGLLYCGDILSAIALLGVPLVLLDRLSSRLLCWVAVLLLLQIPQWPDVLHVVADAAYNPGIPHHWTLYALTDPVFAHGSFGDVVRMNAGTGQGAKWWWLVETYRYPQMLGLFVCGLLLGRSGVLRDPLRLRRHAWRALVASIAGFALVLLAHRGIDALRLKDRRNQVVYELANMYGNLAQMAIWAGAFVLLYGSERARGAAGLRALWTHEPDVLRKPGGDRRAVLLWLRAGDVPPRRPVRGAVLCLGRVCRAMGVRPLVAEAVFLRSVGMGVARGDATYAEGADAPPQAHRGPAGACANDIGPAKQIIS